MNDLDPEGKRLPVKLDATSNGEYCPLDLTPGQVATNKLAHEMASDHSHRLGIGRRGFLTGAVGAASVFAASNTVHAKAGGFFRLEKEAALDEAAAFASVGGDEFIFDVQLHCVDPAGAWTQGKDGENWRMILSRAFAQAQKCTSGEYDCYSAESLAKEVFLDSDTTAGVVSGLFGTDEGNPTPIAYAARTREIVEGMGGGDGKKRCLIHGGVLPNLPGEIEDMERKASYGLGAWKLYPQWGTDGSGYMLDDPSGPADRMFAEARRLGVTNICVHKGVSLPGMTYEQSSPKDMGPAAKANPDLTLITYHSGFQPGVVEGAYDPEGQGLDRLIRSHREAGFKRNEGNLYAELGACWRHFMSRPDEAAHVMGKLLKTFGEDRILWGTDCIWFGSPQDQIQAFRAFEISEEYQEKYGYPALTREAKAKIFGLNAARVYGLDVDALKAPKMAEARADYRQKANPSFRTYGPKTRRDFMALLKAEGGGPG